MTILDQITVLILTKDEAPNIARTLDALRGMSRIVIVDSGSTDATLAIVAGYPAVEVIHRPFDSHEAQWNFALKAARSSRPWVLALDADYVLTPQLLSEIAELPTDRDVAGYVASFRYCIGGRQLSGTLYPPHVVLFKADRAHFIQDGHTQRVVIDGVVADLRGQILHDDRKPLSRWFSSQCRYAQLEAEHLLAKPRDGLRRSDRIRLMAWPAPVLVFLYVLIVKRGLLDGWAGWFYALQRLTVEALICLFLIEKRLAGQFRNGTGEER